MDIINEVYFYLRNNINEIINRALIDEIAYQKKFKTGHPLNYFKAIYVNNKFFRSRKHPIVYQLFPNKTIIKNDGDLDDFVTTVPAGIPLHYSVRPIGL